MPQRASIILAAGHGTRMRSRRPKVMHEVGNLPMIGWSVKLARESGCERIVVVCNPAQTALQDWVRGELGPEALALQDPPQGTGHAVLCAKDAMRGFEGEVAILYGDTPLLRPAAVEALLSEAAAGRIGVLGFAAVEPGAYGRLILSETGALERIVEAKDASPEELSVSTCNSGVMAAPAKLLFELLGEVTNDNAKGEYYLTDTVGLARARGVEAVAALCPESETLGVNSRAELARAEAVFQTRAREAALEQGATLTDPSSVWFSHDTELSPDVTVEPCCVFGPGVRVGEGARIKAFSHLEGAIVGEGCDVGPHARLRPGTTLGAGAKIGNFVETKNVDIGRDAKASHLSYLGDGLIGEGANIGAGTIFCNYDGFGKHRTEVGEGAFIGSNTALVAPVSVGPGAYTGSGSVITRDVPEDSLAVARGRQTVREGWAAAFRKRKRGAGSQEDGR